MATWAVGDIQGCLGHLQRLLERARFDWDRDWLWSVGDVINRGSDCLGTLRFLYRHRERVRVVLGNHDLHLLAVAAGVRKPGRSDTLDEILAAADRDEMLAWLQHRPLLHREHDVTMVHAGIPPQWTIAEAAARAREVEAVLRGPDARSFFADMYGNRPDCWSPDLTGTERLRVITNYFTRMRYCDADGRLDLASKGPLEAPGGPAADDPAFDAWFRHPERRSRDDRIIFGHWASLEGRTNDGNAIGLDTGCVWGNAMTLYNVETGERIRQPCG
ncbi:MAG: symmetrical bis(5'-nucleosyl)-tetraphosphatase [Halieaceae bacterium]|jgi:bis(5'-nucleosyl)-tetraphosphatase (symmetrical)|nr:symmetrical bis(5'-nucleosyl)-tetraphosphatase [Halieaceae bacterium]